MMIASDVSRALKHLQFAQNVQPGSRKGSRAANGFIKMKMKQQSVNG